MDDSKKLDSNERRAALRKMGMFAAYTAPAMMVMLASKKGNAGSWSDEKPGWGWGDDNHNHSGPPGLE